MVKVDDKAMEFFEAFMKVGITGYETFPEVDGDFYKISIRKLSKSQVRRLKDDMCI